MCLTLQLVTKMFKLYSLVFLVALSSKSCTSVPTEIPTAIPEERPSATENSNPAFKVPDSEFSKQKEDKSSCQCKNSCPLKPLTRFPADCEEIQQNGHSASGVYTIYPKGRTMNCKAIQAYCDMGTSGGGWTVIQRRGDYGNPENYFYKDWASYKKGFGQLEREFWLGNDHIHTLTNQGSYSVRFDLRHHNGTSAYAIYDSFWIEDEQQGYKINIYEYSGNAGDSMRYHNATRFLTKDKDNKAVTHQGAWWYTNSFYANLNGLYKKGVTSTGQAKVVSWYYFGGDHNSLDFTDIKIRQNGF